MVGRYPWLLRCHHGGEQNEKLELDFVGGDEEQMLGEALHGCILWRKAYIKVIGNTAVTPVDPLSPPDTDNDDYDFDGGP
jgi:hypothetical protein